LSADPPRLIHQAAPCTASEADTDDGATSRPGGTVSSTKSLDAGTFDVSSSSLPASGTNSCSVHYTPTAVGDGTHTITASYGGDSDHLTSNGGADIAVSKRSTSTTLVCDTPRVIGQASTCTATVADTDVGTTSRPGGTVSFTKSLDGGTFDFTSCSLPASG